MKNYLISAGIAVLSYFLLLASLLWCAVSFILFLVKDYNFNWMSLWFVITSFILFIISSVINIFFKK